MPYGSEPARCAVKRRALVTNDKVFMMWPARFFGAWRPVLINRCLVVAFARTDGQRG